MNYETTQATGAVGAVIWSKRVGLAATVIMVLMAGVGGVLDLMQFNFPLARGLNMPWFVATILGVAKILAVLTFLTPRYPTLREWAYAGLTFELLGAAACHVLSRGPLTFAVPALFDWMFVIVSYFWWQVPKRQQEESRTDPAVCPR